MAKANKESISHSRKDSGSPEKQAPRSPSSKQPGPPKRKVLPTDGKRVATKPQESSSKNNRKRPRNENATAMEANETSVREEPHWSKSKKKRMRHLKAKKTKTAAAADKEQKHDVDKSIVILSPVTALEEQEQLIQSSTETTEVKESTNNQSSLQKSFQERLSGSRFRILNEELYTTTSHAAFERFSRQPELFDEYHAGFRHQVEHWPVNPVQVLVEKLKQQQQQRAPVRNLVVADFGCGDADLAKQLLQSNGDEFTVHSFDLVARGPNADLITACDCADRVPLPSQSVDVGIFCLALMGTNLADFVREAHRVLKADGCLHIAEVRSRFEGSNNNSNTKKKQTSKGDKDPLQVFIATLEKLGFSCAQKDRSNKMFVLLELKKNGKKPKKDLSFTAKPCIYKRR